MKTVQINSFAAVVPNEFGDYWYVSMDLKISQQVDSKTPGVRDVEVSIDKGGDGQHNEAVKTNRFAAVSPQQVLGLLIWLAWIQKEPNK